MTRWKIGNAPKRREDERFVTGRATYLDDYSLPGMVHAVVLRSPHAHAIIERLDEPVARAPGVLAVLTATDVKRDGLGPLFPTAEANLKTGEPFAFMPQPLLATNKVRYVGEPVALIIAFTAEMIAGGGGAGAALMFAQRFFQTPTVFVYILIMLATGLILDRVMLRLRHWLIPWHDESA